MATNLAIDNDLLDLALQVGRLRTKKATFTLALEEFIRHRKSQEIIKLQGTIDYDEDYAYKAIRSLQSNG
ncbi:MAG: type II toxin-antitoxin system VapB family antitoxin [Coriobacteriales bacterium]|nr:type II toxin-antitoxin system VapB family antitoxin [Coriobacteriales bacterium]